MNSSNQSSKLRPSQYFLWGFSIGYLSLGSWLAFSDKVPAATLCIGAAFLLLLIANIDKLEHFKGLGIEAKMRQLDERINEADDWLKHMRDLSRAMAQMTFETLSRTGRWSGPPPRSTSLEIAKTLKRHMQAIGIDNTEIDAAMEPWHRTNLWDMNFPIFSAIRQVLQDLQSEWQKRLQAYPQPIVADDEKYQELIDKTRMYGSQIEELEKRIKEDVYGFSIHAEDIIATLRGLPDGDKAALLAKTEKDRRAVMHYAKTKTFLSESSWIADQPTDG